MAKAQAQEPSMEEILASIRRIIADEETAPKGAAPAPAPVDDTTISEDDLDKLFSSADAESPIEDDDVLDLTEDLAEAAAPDHPPMVEGLNDGSDIAFADLAEPEPDPEPEPVKAPPRVEPRPAPAPEPVFVAAPPPPPPPRPAAKAPARRPAPAPEPVEPEPVEEVSSLLSGTTEGMVSNAFNDLALTVLNRNARTLEDLVQDMLRPMLKTWLDQNLPGMVERMVRAEIERVTRGR